MVFWDKMIVLQPKNCCNAYGHDKNGNKAASHYNSVLLAPNIIQCALQAIVIFASAGPAYLAS